ncbi:hypothetical protein [Natrinema halophilum]|uniref:Uncharacterized protein n=1 Tax=Natrinema halophilum TaxID=1699371 RepID=A0A7D5GV84_9EURY|nr:hypothetical protein [Natrinema halophilum]QLG50606.1 hypothetical protein HYG82_18060 [Natrinema halophilum]
MSSNKLVAYWIQLKERGSDKNYWDLSELRDHEVGLYYGSIVDIFEDVCRCYTDYTYVDEANDETFTVEFYERSGNLIEGQYLKGDSGVIANHFDKRKGSREYEARTTDISEEIPFYFLFYLPSNNTDRALLILREFENKGVKRIATDRFQKILQGVTQSGIYEDSRAVTEDYWSAIQRADRIKKIRLKGKSKLRSIDEVDGESANVQNINREFVLRPQTTTFLPEVLKPLFNKEIKYAGIELDEFDEKKITIEQGGSELTFSAVNPRVDMRMILNNTDVDIIGGHPTPETISVKAREFANYILDEYDDLHISDETILHGDYEYEYGEVDDSRGRDDRKTTISDFQ